MTTRGRYLQLAGNVDRLFKSLLPDAEVAREKLGLDSLGGGYTRVANAAKSVGLEDWFLSTNSFLSKFAHPSAGLVLGIMHQAGTLRALQATLTTTGGYFAGQCVIALEEIVLAFGK